MTSPAILSKEIFLQLKQGYTMFTDEERIETLLELSNFLEVEKMKLEERITLCEQMLDYSKDLEGDIAYRSYHSLALANKKGILIDFFQPLSEVEREFLEEINRKAQKAYNINQIPQHNRLFFIPYRRTQKLKINKSGEIKVITDQTKIRGVKRKRIYIRTVPTEFEKKPICPNCKDEKKNSFYFEQIDKWICRECGNEWKENNI